AASCRNPRSPRVVCPTSRCQRKREEGFAGRNRRSSSLRRSRQMQTTDCPCKTAPKQPVIVLQLRFLSGLGDAWKEHPPKFSNNTVAGRHRATILSHNTH